MGQVALNSPSCFCPKLFQLSFHHVFHAQEARGHGWLCCASCCYLSSLPSAVSSFFVAGRFFAGFGVGMVSAMIPLYQSESSPKWICGTIVGAYQWAITISLLLASIVGNSTKNRNDTGIYRIPIAVQFAWALVIFVGMLFLSKPHDVSSSRANLKKLHALSLA